jgi:hypothetical protein
MAEGVVEKLTGFLSGFRPRTFQSDQQAAQYNQNLSNKKRFSLGELARLHADFAPAQEDLRDGDADDPSTKKFVQMMDSHAVDLPDDVIVSRVVGPDAFGLTPETMNAPDGGLEDFTGKKIADRGYSPVNLGTPLGGGSGQVTMSIAVPKGTKATIPGQGGNDRTMYLQRSQSYRVTKVKPDGRGGYYMLAVAEDDGLEAPEPIGGHVGAGKPSNREGAVRDLQRSQAERMKAEGEQPSTVPTPVGAGGQPQVDNTPQTQPTLPDGTQPRTEPVAAESIGGGPAPTAPARTDVTPAAPSATVPETPAAPAGAPLEDADVAKLRLRRDSKARYQEIARAAPVAQAMAGLSELDSKKVDDKAKAAEIRRILASPVMDEVPKESVGIRADLEKVASDFEAGKPNLAKARMTRLSKAQGLTSGDKAGSVVNFDEATMEAVGDIPEDGKVEVLRPAITKTPILGSGEPVVMERAQVTGAITPSARRAAKKAAAPAAKKAAPVAKKAAPVKAAPVKAAPAAPGEITDKSTVADLKKIAADRGVDIKGLRLKKDIRDRIEGKSEPAKKTTAAQQREAVKANREGNIKGREAAAKTMVGEGLGSISAVAKAVSKKEPATGEPDIDKMTKADLLKHAESVGVTVRPSWTKDKIKDQIRSGGKTETTKVPVKKAATPAKKVVAPVAKPVSTPKGKPAGAPVRTLRQVTDGSGRIIKDNRPKSDEPIYYPNNGQDQGLVHLDSEVGSLWADLYADDREPNSFINKIAKLGDELGEDKVSLTDVVKRLKELRGEATDTGVQARMDKAIEAIDAPPFKMPNLPEGLPAPIRKYLSDLAEVPTARKTGRVGSSLIQEPVIDQKIKAIRDFSEGKIRGRELERILQQHDLHESADGALKMWKLGDRILTRSFSRVERQNGKLVDVSEPNPDWPAIQEWLRKVSAQHQNR